MNSQPDYYIAIASLVTACVSLLTVIATFMSVRELKKQRQASFKPDIYLKSSNVYLYTLKHHSGDLLPFNVSQESTGSNQAKSTFYRPTIDIYNIGAGAAKSLRLKADYNLKEIIDLIHSVNSEGYFHTFFTNRTLTISVPSIGYNPVFFVENELSETNIDFSLPSNSGKSVNSIPIPMSYVYLYIVYVYSILFSKPRNGEVRTYTVKPFPKLYYNVEFNDLEDTQHQSDFSVSLDIVSITSFKEEEESNVPIATITVSVNRETKKSNAPIVDKLLEGSLAAITRHLIMNLK